MKKFDINQFKPCEAALEWYNQQPSTEAAWANCHRSDWMLWIAYRLGIDIRLLTLAAGYCAKTVYHLMTDERSKDAVVAAINYGRGKIGEDELKDAADAAYATVNAAYADYAATDAANAAAYAAYCATDNPGNAVYYADRANNNKPKSKQQIADICRKYLTDAVFNKIKQLP